MGKFLSFFHKFFEDFFLFFFPSDIEIAAFELCAILRDIRILKRRFLGIENKLVLVMTLIFLL
jgi:hypothetical protein